MMKATASDEQWEAKPQVGASVLVAYQPSPSILKALGVIAI